MKKKARVGIIIDGGNVSNQIFELFKQSETAKNYEISCLIIQEQITAERSIGWLSPIKTFFKKALTLGITGLIFQIIFNIEKLFVMRNKDLSDVFKKFDVSELKIPKLTVHPHISKSGHFYRYSESDLNKIKSQNLQILVRGGSGILRGSILDLTPLGVISFHHGNNNAFRGGPPGYWEVYETQPTTGFIIQVLSEELDGGDVIFRGEIPTSWFHALNVARIYKKANPFMHQTLEKIFGDKNDIENFAQTALLQTSLQNTNAQSASFLCYYYNYKTSKACLTTDFLQTNNLEC